MSENFNEQNENNQNEYGTSQNIYGNTQTTYGDTQNSYGSENNYGGTQNSYGGTQNTYGYNNQPQYQSGMENQQQELVPQMSVGQWMLTYLLVNIPIVNIVMYIIWLIGKNPKDAIRKNWARGQLFYLDHDYQLLLHIYGSYYIWNYVDLHNYCFDGFNAGRWKFEWLQ